MGKWIRLEERLPEMGERIWARFSKKNGEARAVNPVREGDYGKFPYDESHIGFIFGEHRNIAFSVDYCAKVGLTHWQSRLDETPPSPQCATTEVVSAPPAEKRMKRSYKLSPEGLAAKQERMREYWRKRKSTCAEN